MDPGPAIPECALLSLGELRIHRRILDDEENRVSYWRRLIQARADIVQAGAALTEGDARSLERVLAGDHALTVRTSRLHLSASEDAPPLPDIAAVWTRLDDPTDPTSRAQLVLELRRIEQELSTYRHDLHQRIAAATAETIARYRVDPALCLTALPPRQRRAS
ncbi:MAG: hypothetical protein M3O55_08810 [Actinomycetota bacterium]|nr:hypothetical protein [Actinomycetota bacterium]